MATFINVATGDDGLLSQIKAQQQARRFAHEEQNRRKEIEEARDKTEQEEEEDWRSLDPSERKRKLTAHRHPGGGTWAWTFNQLQPSVTAPGNFITIQGALDDKQVKPGTGVVSTDSVFAYGSPDGRAWDSIVAKYQFAPPPVGGFNYICDYALNGVTFKYGERRARAFDSTGQSGVTIAIPAGNKTGIIVGVRAIKAVYADVTGYFTYQDGVDSGMEFRGVATPTQPVDNPSHSFDFHDNSTRDYYAFFVAKGVVRRIGLPNTLKTALDILSPLPTFSTQTFRLNFVDHTYQVPVYAPPTELSSDGVFVGLGGTHRTAAPDMFRYINDIAPFTALALQSAADWVAAGHWPVAANATVSGYKRIWDATSLSDFYTNCPVGERLAVHEWLSTTVPGRPWDASSLKATAKWRTPFPRQARSLASVIPNFNVERPCTGVMDEFWDWGDPIYCQTQLLALGFSAADFKP